MNKIIRQESRINVFGVDCLAHNVIIDDQSNIIRNQKIVTSRTYSEGGDDFRITVKLRFDDECGNGHESFAITGDIQQKIGNRWRDDRCGTIHEDIAKHFPEFAHLIKWHLVDIDGPLHYVANTVYHASNRDHNGLLAGEPNMNPAHLKYGIKFENVPIVHTLKKSFFEFIKARIGTGDFQAAPIGYEKTKTSDYDFAPKWTLAGYGEKWHECPFDSKDAAFNFAEALNTCKAEFVVVPGVFGKGKARDFDAARSCAVWPDATDAELSLEKPELTKLLLARLPALMSEFKADMLGVGFVYPKRED